MPPITAEGDPPRILPGAQTLVADDDDVLHDCRIEVAAHLRVDRRRIDPVTSAPMCWPSRVTIIGAFSP
jgi:hypothetical protein